MPAQVASPSVAAAAAVAEPAARGGPAAAPADGNFAKVLQGQAARGGPADNAGAPAAAPAASPVAVGAAASKPTDAVTAILALLLPQAKRPIGAAVPAADGAASAVPQAGDRAGAAKDAPSPTDTAWLPPAQTIFVSSPATTKSSTATEANGASSANTNAADHWSAEPPANLAAAALKQATTALVGKAGSAPNTAPVGAKAPDGENFQAALTTAAARDSANPSALQSTATALASANAAGLHAAAPASSHGTPALTIAAPVGSAAWSAEIGDKLTWMVNHQEQRAEFVLNPPHLGRIEVSLSLSGDQANAMFVSANPAVRDAIAAAIPHLRDLMAGVGVNLGQTQVGAESAGHSAQQGESGDNSWRGTHQDGLQNSATAAAAAASPWLGRGRGMVDVFA